MGFDYEVYIGAYLEIHAQPVMVKGDKVCPNEHVHGGGEYCSKCGQRLVWLAKDRRPHLWELLDDEDNERLTEADAEFNRGETVFAIGNLFDEPEEPTCYNFGEHFRVDITPQDASVFCENFAKKYAGEIEQLKRNADRVELKFGALGYWY